MKTYEKAEKICRNEHIPVIIHVNELTQPLGHSTSGSHERYKSEERLKWERDYDCIKKMREWILENKIVNSKDLDKIESDSKKSVSKSKIEAKRNSINQTVENISKLNSVLKENINSSNSNIANILDELNKVKEPYKRDLFTSANKIIRELMLEKNTNINLIKDWLRELRIKTQYLSLIHI